jgi:hypothetical protein
MKICAVQIRTHLARFCSTQGWTRSVFFLMCGSGLQLDPLKYQYRVQHATTSGTRPKRISQNRTARQINGWHKAEVPEEESTQRRMRDGHQLIVATIDNIFPSFQTGPSDAAVNGDSKRTSPGLYLCLLNTGIISPPIYVPSLPGPPAFFASSRICCQIYLQVKCHQEACSAQENSWIRSAVSLGRNSQTNKLWCVLRTQMYVHRWDRPVMEELSKGICQRGKQPEVEPKT